MTDKKQQHKNIKSFISGGTAGIVAKTIIAPIERVKYLFITTNRKFTYRVYIADVVHIVKKHGVLNLWRGNLMNIAKIFPHAAVDFAVFDYLRARFYHKQGGFFDQLRLFLCGAAAGGCALTISTPFEFIRVRLAMERDSFTYKNNTSAARMILQRQGFLGFYRGYGAAICGIFIYHGSSFFIFTKLKQFVKRQHPQSYRKWYVDFSLGAFSSIGQLIAYPFDVLRKRMQGQALLLSKGQIQKLSNYKELLKEIYHGEGGIKGFYKGISLNMFKAPLSTATAWTVKNYINRILDNTYDF